MFDGALLMGELWNFLFYVFDCMPLSDDVMRNHELLHAQQFPMSAQSLLMITPKF